jgi:hypothetical protein
MTNETAEQLLNRFWKNVDKKQDCWLWTGSSHKGYGWFYIGPKSDFAHRLSYYFSTGELVRSPFCVLHKNSCNNKRCVRPDHLYKGTAKDNKRDQIEKDGKKSGGRRVKLGDISIAEVLILSGKGVSQRDIAKIMNVSQWNIWNILKNIK